ncbi:MAG: cupin domain-containing protein [Pelosinus sp.]|nr:cupin domain-containing protein [Pelosinus sp.]
MTTKDNNYTLTDIGSFKTLKDKDFNGITGKYFAGSELGLTGCEVSISCLPAGKATKFVHAHKKNEELYIITSGDGKFFVDGKEFTVQEGSLIRVAPQGERALAAGEKDLHFICIQAQEGSLTQATFNDGIVLETKASWMK